MMDSAAFSALNDVSMDAGRIADLLEDVVDRLDENNRLLTEINTKLNLSDELFETNNLLRDLKDSLTPPSEDHYNSDSLF